MRERCQLSRSSWRARIQPACCRCCRLPLVRGTAAAGARWSAAATASALAIAADIGQRFRLAQLTHGVGRVQMNRLQAEGAITENAAYELNARQVRSVAPAGRPPAAGWPIRAGSCRPDVRGADCADNSAPRLCHGLWAAVRSVLQGVNRWSFYSPAGTRLKPAQALLGLQTCGVNNPPRQCPQPQCAQHCRRPAIGPCAHSCSMACSADDLRVRGRELHAARDSSRPQHHPSGPPPPPPPLC